VKNKAPLLRENDPGGIDWFAISCVAGFLLSVLVVLNRVNDETRGPASVPQAGGVASPVPDMTPFIPGH
jgi:hypothetical protein